MYILNVGKSNFTAKILKSNGYDKLPPRRLLNEWLSWNVPSSLNFILLYENTNNPLKLMLNI